MEAVRFDEFHKYGCNFYGKLVAVNYIDDMQNDPKWGTWNGGITYDYCEKAEKLVLEKYGKPVRVLLSIPEYVCEIA
jgi:hypothetical protein